MCASGQCVASNVQAEPGVWSQVRRSHAEQIQSSGICMLADRTIPRGLAAIIIKDLIARNECDF